MFMESMMGKTTKNTVVGNKTSMLSAKKYIWCKYSVSGAKENSYGSKNSIGSLVGYATLTIILVRLYE